MKIVADIIARHLHIIYVYLVTYSTSMSLFSKNVGKISVCFTVIQITHDVYKNKSLNNLYTVNLRSILVCLGPYKMNKLMFMVFIQVKGPTTIILKSHDP